MRHRRETIPPLNLRTVRILILGINGIYISVAYETRILNFAAYRDASQEGEGKGEKREESAYQMTSNMSRCRE